MRKILFTLLISLFCGNTFSQVVTLNAGFNFSFVNASYSPTVSTVSDTWYKSEFPTYFDKVYLGWNLSAGIQYFNRKRFFLSSNVGLNDVGANGSQSQQDGDDGIYSIPRRSEFLFLSVNALANYKLAESGGFSFYVGFGPRVDFLIDQKLPSINVLDFYAIPANMNQVVWGLNGTLGIHYAYKRLQFGTDLGLNYNISNLLNYTTERFDYTNPGDSKDINFSMKINYVTTKISIGYILNYQEHAVN